MNDTSDLPAGLFEALWANEQFKSGLRTGIQTIGTAIAAKGVIDASWVPGMAGFVMWLIPTVWGLYVRRKAGLVASAAALPEVAKIVTTPALVAKLDDPTVTTH